MNTRELLVKILDIYGILDKYVILKQDEKGRYIEYAFKEGAPKDNRCLSWYDNLIQKREYVMDIE